MAKSKMRFNTPRIWTARAECVMREDDGGGWVRLHDYNELLYAYRGALVQLDRAAKRIAWMKQTTSNAKFTGAEGVRCNAGLDAAQATEKK